MKKMVGDDKKYNKYAYNSLFKTIGVPEDEFAFNIDKKGVILGGSSFFLAPRAFIKLGKLLLNKGKWDGKQIIDPAFIKEMTTISSAIKGSPEGVQKWEGPTGAGVWLNDDQIDDHDLERMGIPSQMPEAPRDMIYAGGYLGQFLMIFPSQNLVVAKIGGMSDYQWQWSPFANKSYSCFSDGQLREKVDRGKNNEEPDTGKKLKLKEIGKNKIIVKARAQELCNCLFVNNRYDSTKSHKENIKQCDSVIPSKLGLALGITTHTLIGKMVIRPEQYSVSVKRRFGRKGVVAQYDPKKPNVACNIVKNVVFKRKKK
jgi:hypothetical protein